jgi:thiamine pyrophosphokinase
MTARPGLRALVLADGDRSPGAALDAAWPGWRDGIELVVAADGGARQAAELGLAIDLWVGDGDSLDGDSLAALRLAGVPVVVASTDKDESDTELALLAALDQGATDVTILGALGGRRFDHALANVGLLTHPRLRALAARLLDERTRVTLVSAPGTGGEAVRHQLPGRVGDVVSLLPLGDRVEGITTMGLRYPLRDEPLETGPARGLSNLREGDAASVTVRHGRLLIVESPATLAT